MIAALLIYVVIERLLELVISHRNTARLMAEGGHEIGADHYPFMVAMHVSWLVAIIMWAWTLPHDINASFMVLYLIVQPFRFWVMVSLGRYWTTRVITVPNAPLVKRGPYRFVKHPNYVVVAVEIAVLPLVFGAWQLAVVFSVLNVAMLWVRVRAENKALAARN